MQSDLAQKISVMKDDEIRTLLAELSDLDYKRLRRIIMPKMER